MNDVAGNKLTDAEAEREVETFHARLGAIRTEVRKIIVGQDDVVDHLLLTLLVGGHCLITGMPGTAKTLLVRTLAYGARPEVQAHPVHAGPDADRRHRHRHHRRGHHDRSSPLDVRARADLRERAARGRNQSHAAEDAGRAARSDAGALGDGARHDAYAERRRSSCWRRRIRSSWKARIRCPKRSSTASCSTCCSTT